MIRKLSGSGTCSPASVSASPPLSPTLPTTRPSTPPRRSTTRDAAADGGIAKREEREDPLSSSCVTEARDAVHFFDSWTTPPLRSLSEGATRPRLPGCEHVGFSSLLSTLQSRIMPLQVQLVGWSLGLCAGISRCKFHREFLTGFFRYSLACGGVPVTF